MRDARSRKLAHLIVHHSTALEAGEAILIEAFDVSGGLVLDLVEEVQAAGGIPVVSVRQNAVIRSLASSIVFPCRNRSPALPRPHSPETATGLPAAPAHGGCPQTGSTGVPLACDPSSILLNVEHGQQDKACDHCDDREDDERQDGDANDLGDHPAARQLVVLELAPGDERRDKCGKHPEHAAEKREGTDASVHLALHHREVVIVENPIAITSAAGPARDVCDSPGPLVA